MFVCATRRPRPLGTCLLIGWQLLVGVGLPLPVPEHRSHERFPCENCPCGCATAERCWRHCCCFTNQEKLAWARKNGVPVPEYVVTAAETERDSQSRPCCPHCTRKASEHLSPTPIASRRAAGVRCRVSQSAPPGISFVQALRCRGVLEFWQELASSVPVRILSVTACDMEPKGYLAPRSLLGLTVNAPEPPTPPPRVSCGVSHPEVALSIPAYARLES
jgi:hypothetical protein